MGGGFAQGIFGITMAADMARDSIAQFGKAGAVAFGGIAVGAVAITAIFSHLQQVAKEALETSARIGRESTEYGERMGGLGREPPAERAKKLLAEYKKAREELETRSQKAQSSWWIWEGGKGGHGPSEAQLKAINDQRATMNRTYAEYQAADRLSKSGDLKGFSAAGQWGGAGAEYLGGGSYQMDVTTLLRQIADNTQGLAVR